MSQYLDGGDHAGTKDVGTPREQASVLLAKYPNLDASELTRLSELYRTFSALDSALILSDEALAPKLDRFRAEHRSKLRPHFRQYAGLLFYTGLTLAAVLWVLATL